MQPRDVAEGLYPSAEEIRPARLAEGFLLDGRYRIRRMLAEGGVGAVFEADQVTLNRRVAVKVLHPAFLSVDEVVQRFRREAVALARLSGRHVVSVLDVGEGETPDGVLPYIAMELLDGETLGDRLRRGAAAGRAQLPVGEATRIITQVLEALAVVHRRGMLHRDLKPENIFLARGKAEGEVVKLVDFGLSRWEGEGSTVRLTRMGLTLGTPAYMAPEQASGDRAADHRVDLFAVGVSLYEMLTGKLPFDGPNYAVILTRVLTVAPVAPRTLRADLAPELEAVILRALEKDPDARFLDAESFVAALQPFLRADDTAPFTVAEARGVAPTVRVTPVELRRRLRLWGAAAALVVAATALFASHKSTPPPAEVLIVKVPAPVRHSRSHRRAHPAPSHRLPATATLVLR